MIKLLSKFVAFYTHKKNQKWIKNPLYYQENTLKHLIKNARKTTFGKEHHFDKIKTYKDFTAQVPIRDYEELRPYVNKIIEGESDVLWPKKPIYFALTSGTTSGKKYIPLTKESLPQHIRAAKEALLNYIYKTGKNDFVSRKQIFLQASPELENKNGILQGRLSGIVAHYVPKYLQKSRMPSWEANCIDDWETKVNKIVDETLAEDMGVISGIPPWVEMYFKEIIKRTKKPIKDVFKNFSLFVYGGVNFDPYRSIFKKLIGKDIDSVEVFPASEGFFAYQDDPNEKGLLLLLNHGIFYEFVKADEIHSKSPKRIALQDVELNVNYVMIISTTAGLWGYNIGDTIKFVSKKPYRVVVTGRTKYFTSAFGEHVISKEVETALKQTLDIHPAIVIDFTVAPEVNPKKGLPYHEWFIEFEKEPNDLKAFEKTLDEKMCLQNVYYKDLIDGAILKPLSITMLSNKAFQQYMKAEGKLGGQNKIPHLSNDRKIADKLIKFVD